MNRIRELREQAGLSADALGQMLKPPAKGPTITRLENGDRQLTERWMRRIAEALQVEPAELLESAALASIKNEIRPVSSAARVVTARLRQYKVLVETLADAGLKAGATFIADHGDNAVSSVGTGDLVVAEMWSRATPNATRCHAIRMFIAPDMLVTHRPGMNLALKLSDPAVQSEIVAVIDPHSIEPHQN
jgi:transcriptional regulator with XRE-family HTH domain